MGGRGFQRHARVVLGQGRQPLCARLERRRANHEAGAGQTIEEIIQMSVIVRTFGLLIMVVATSGSVLADEKSPAAGQPTPTRIGAVAYSPAAVTIFHGLTGYLNKHGLPSDYVLYSNYDSLVAALDR